MKDYTKSVLKRYEQAPHKKPQLLPHQHTTPTYGANVQYENDPDSSDSLDKAGTKMVHGVIGALLFFARATENKPLCALSTIASQ